MKNSKNKIFGTKTKVIASILAMSVLTTAAYAQRDPAYQNARTSGHIGEKIDGYLGVIGNQSGAISALTSKINILRKQVYTKTAVSRGISVEKAAFLGGCKNIVRTVAGEKYETPAGSWATRDANVPKLDSACP